jgi:hypothetical protein
MKYADKQYIISIECPLVHPVQRKRKSNLETNGSTLNKV